MINKYNSIGELIEDPLFNEFLKKNIDDIASERTYRTAPRPEHNHKRDVIDRMRDKNQFNIDFIKEHIESVWESRSELTSETRSAILNITKKTICDLLESTESDLIDQE